MSKKLKSFLGLSAIIALILFGVSSLIFSRAFSDFASPERTFSVSAEKEVTAKPDVVTFEFSVITEGGKNLEDLQNTNSKKMNSAIKFVKDQGVKKEDIKTTNYNISPRYNRYRCPEPQKGVRECPPSEIVGYTVSQDVRVKLKDFSKLSKILSGVVENGANSVSNISFTVENKDKLKEKAKEKAIKAAKKKAKDLAKDAGFKVGRLLSVREGFSVPRSGGGAFDAAYKREAASTPDIEPGSEKIKADVTLRYEIK